MPEPHRVLILMKAPSGESFLKLHLLGPELGCALCLKRVSSKKQSQKAAPDLFDTAEIQLDTAKSGTAQFVGEYEVTRRRSEIGLNYRALSYASDFSNLLIANGSHLADLHLLYQLAERSLDAFAAQLEPSVVYLKSVYLLLKDEGYPVRESWWPQIPNELRSTVRELLSKPSPRSISPEIRQSCETTIKNLQHWLRRESDLTLPGEIL